MAGMLERHLLSQPGNQPYLANEPGARYVPPVCVHHIQCFCHLLKFNSFVSSAKNTTCLRILIRMRDRSSQKSCCTTTHLTPWFSCFGNLLIGLKAIQRCYRPLRGPRHGSTHALRYLCLGTEQRQKLEAESWDVQESAQIKPGHPTEKSTCLALALEKEKGTSNHSTVADGVKPPNLGLPLDGSGDKVSRAILTAATLTYD